MAYLQKQKLRIKLQKQKLNGKNKNTAQELDYHAIFNTKNSSIYFYGKE